ncbi:YtxH domain-containing protein [Paenibacillus sp. MAH-36]|uniref:YtxH domain-containing protein n=1 Tax=Paenibacillus violae TaxID=3077234 RepID=A0ABU3RLA4_9BACL|nr:YtxH domain-containing protein [Paenibacillus sp. PFR10]MDU0205046.1 YtxH domain-containing protein [Paenibacillus sp. PFR10]
MSETVETNRSGLLLGLVIGGAIGAVASLLLAPKKGAELRDNLTTTYRNLSDKTNQFAAALGQKTKEMAAKTADKTEEMAEKLSDKTQDLAEIAGDKVQEFGEKASEKASTKVQEIAEPLQSAKPEYSNNRH